MVDMPGYGYAKVSKTQVAEWTALIKDYLRGRPNLRCCFIMVDSRHGLKDSDREIMKMLGTSAHKDKGLSEARAIMAKMADYT